MMASSLNELGLLAGSVTLSKFRSVVELAGSFPGYYCGLFLQSLYFCQCYCSRSCYVCGIIGVGVSLGIPPMLLAMMLGFMGSIYGVLTHYGHGPAPVFFGSGYVDLKAWWLRGLEIGIVY
jgi:DASS family divalent anion:Na+ symporter